MFPPVVAADVFGVRTEFKSQFISPSWRRGQSPARQAVVVSAKMARQGCALVHEVGEVGANEVPRLKEILLPGCAPPPVVQPGVICSLPIGQGVRKCARAAAAARVTGR